MIPHGYLKKMSETSNISVQLLCDYVARRKFPSRKRAEYLEKVCKELNLDLTKEEWLFLDADAIKIKISELRI